MALPVNRPSEENNKKPEPEATGGGLPTSPPPVVRSLPLQPAKIHAEEEAGSRFLDDEEAIIERTNRRKDLDVSANATSYQSLSNITANEVITIPYEKNFKRLENKVVEVKSWLQEYISQENLTERVGQARRERGPALIEMKQKLDQLLLRYFSNNPVGTQQDASKISSLVLNEVLGLGPLEPLWQDSNITEIMVNGPKRTYIEIGGKLQRAVGVQFRDSDHLLEMIQQVLGGIGKTLDIAHSYEDGRLTDGSRINATHPVIGPGGPYLTIRRFPETVFSLRKLIEMGSMTGEMAEEIGNLIYHQCSTIVSGGTGSGKTSMLNALSGCIPETDRIITIEDNLELRLHPDRHVAALESRKALQAEGKGNVTIRDLVKNSLRMRPTRIVIGEVRDGTAYDMLQAMNTGHEGSMTTIHANDAQGALERLSNLIAQVGELSSNQALTLISSGVDIIVSISRFEDGSRRVETVSEIPSKVHVDKSGHVSLDPVIIWEFEQTGLDENNRVVGDYVKREEFSPEFRKKHRLNNKRRIPLQELLELSDWDGKSE
jgi:pilus assembly protein CpaF